MSRSDARLEPPVAPRCCACGSCGFKCECEEQCLPFFFRNSLTTSAAIDHFAGRTQEGRRATIGDLLLAGVRPSAIMNLTGYSRGQIQGVQQRLANGRGMAPQPGSRRPHHNSGIRLAHLDDLARHHGRWSSKTMARSLELNSPDELVTDRTVRRIFHRDLQFKFGKLWRKFKLTELHKQNRVVWSLLHAEDSWERTLLTFLNESCFALTPDGVGSWYPDGNRAPIFEAEQLPKKLHVLGAIP